MAQERSALKLKKKKWYQILAPKEFNEAVIGETPSLDPRLLIDRVVAVNLMDITRDVKKQNINMKFKVTGLKENKAETEVIGYQTINTFIKRIIRRDRNNLHDSFVCKTSDEKNVRLKPLMITVSKTKGVVTNSLMRMLRANLAEYVEKITYKELVNDLVSHKLQSSLKNSLKKIYPLRSLEIKEMLLETEKKIVGKKEAKEKKKPKEKTEIKGESNKAEDKKAELGKKKEKEDKPKEEGASQDNSNKQEREVEDKKRKNPKQTKKEGDVYAKTSD